MRRTLRLAILLFPFLVWTALAAAAGLSGPEDGGRREAAASMIPAEIHAWVYLRDKGESLGRDIELLLDETANNLLPRARARRQRNMSGGIVDYRDIPVCSDYAAEIERHAVRLRRKSRWLNAVSVAATLSELRQIGELPFVLMLAPVRRLGRTIPEPTQPRGRGETTDPGSRPLPADSAFYGPSYPQLREIEVPAVHDSGFSGAGVLVGMLDTGYYKEHPALEGLPIVAEWDFIMDDGETQNEPGDDPAQQDHGTATWSILGGYAPGELIGAAYGASFALAKVEDITSETPAEEDNFVAALEWMDSLGVDLASASLAYRFFDDPENNYEWEDLDGNTATTTVAVDLAASRGILVVCAAGNYGPDPGSLGTPADADSSVTVGGSDEENDLLLFSSRGPTWDGRTKPEVLARGVDAYHAFPDPEYSYSAGTSVATPLVAGCAALVMEAHPQWSAQQVRRALMWTADRAWRPDSDWGWGRINVLHAIYREARPHVGEPAER